MKKHSDLKNEMIALKFGGAHKRIEQIVPDQDFDIDKVLEFQQGLRVLMYIDGVPWLIKAEDNGRPTYTESEIMTEAEEAHEVKRFKEKLMATMYLIVGMAFIGLGWLIAKGCV